MLGKHEMLVWSAFYKLYEDRMDSWPFQKPKCTLFTAPLKAQPFIKVNAEKFNKMLYHLK